MEERIHMLQERLIGSGTDGMIITRHTDIYYFTGTMQAGFLFVPAVGEPMFYVRRSVNRAKEESGIAIEPLGSLRLLGGRIAESQPGFVGKRKIAVTSDTLPVEWYERFQSLLPDAEWTNGSKLIRELRMVKDASEIDRIRRGGRMVGEALQEALKRANAGMKEIDLLAEIEYELRKRGHLGMMRVRSMNSEMVTGIAASGAAAAKPSSFDGPAGGEGLHPSFAKGAGWSTIERNEPILLDIGCNCEGYIVDQTRTAVFGELPEDLRRAYEISETILRSIERELKPGANGEHIHELSLRLAAEAGLADHFMGFGADAVKFVGHGVGLEVDEWPVLAKGFACRLEAGMVIAIEPKFTFPGRGVVGIENTYAITDTGFELLSPLPEGLWALN